MAEEDYDEINRILNNNTDLPKEEQLEKVTEFVNETMKNMTPEDVAKAQKMKEDAQLIKDEFFKLVSHCMYEICLFKGYPTTDLNKDVICCHEQNNYFITVEAIKPTYKIDLQKMYQLFSQPISDQICSKLLSLVNIYYKEMCKANEFEYEEMIFDPTTITLSLKKSNKFEGVLRFGIIIYNKDEFESKNKKQ